MGKSFKEILPERIPPLAAIFYTWLPARMFEPHYKAIADTIKLKDGAVLLDIGTGPGVLPIMIAKKFPNARIAGIDLSEKMIEIADKKSSGLNNVSFQVMNAGALKYNDNSLDMVISTGSMHHWKEPVKIINEIYRVLKPGCEAWIYDGYGEATEEDIKKGIKPVFFGIPSPKMAKRILGLHGFSKEEYDTKIKEMAGQTKFKTCLFEPQGIMMRLRLKK